MFCPKCGKELADGSKFCNSCGMPLSGAFVTEESESVKRKSQNRKIGILVVSAVVLVVAALIVLIVSLLKSESYEAPLDHLFQGIQKKDAEEVIKAFPKDIWEASDVSWEKEDTMEYLQEELEDLLGSGKIKITYQILKEEEYTQRQRRSLSRDLRSYGMEVEELDEAYALKIQVYLEEDDGWQFDIEDLQSFLNSNARNRGSSFKDEVIVGKLNGEWCLLGGLMMPWG
ncbi:zinc-ribbon domain-containing protein [Hominifimenecus sp. rT4P-3]|uniref:zinc ribbon domain-containing protein n=1 Tax=Hominifimenecus sp. rT4P-3 TaxID=3242979 RepID=UPI003DA6A1BC